MSNTLQPPPDENSDFKMYDITTRSPRSIQFPAYYTCWGRFHSKTSLRICVLADIIIQIFIFVLNYKHGVYLTNMSLTTSTVIDVMNFVALVSICTALYTQNTRWCFPFIFIKLFVVSLYFLGSIICALLLIFPSVPAYIILPKMTTGVEEALRLVIFVHMSLFELWFYRSTLAAYVYYQDRNSKSKAASMLLLFDANRVQNASTSTADNNHSEFHLPSESTVHLV